MKINPAGYVFAQKSRPTAAFGHFLQLPSLCKALGAINGLVVSGQERNLRFLATAGANGVMHFAFATALLFAAATAIFAADGFVLEAFFRVEFLFSACENEVLSAIAAHQCFVLEHVVCSFPLIWIFFWQSLTADLVFAPTLAGGRIRS